MKSLLGIRGAGADATSALPQPELQSLVRPNPGSTGTSPPMGQSEPSRLKFYLRWLAQRPLLNQGSPSSRRVAFEPQWVLIRGPKWKWCQWKRPMWRMLSLKNWFHWTYTWPTQKTSLFWQPRQQLERSMQTRLLFPQSWNAFGQRLSYNNTRARSVWEMWGWQRK